MLLGYWQEAAALVVVAAYALAHDAANQITANPSWIMLMIHVIATIVTVTVAVMKLGDRIKDVKNDLALSSEKTSSELRVIRLRLRRVERGQGVLEHRHKDDPEEDSDDDT